MRTVFTKHDEGEEEIKNKKAETQTGTERLFTKERNTQTWHEKRLVQGEKKRAYGGTEGELKTVVG